MEPTRRSPLLVAVLGLAVTALGCVVLLGWAIDSDGLTRLLPQLVAMQPAKAEEALFAVDVAE